MPINTQTTKELTQSNVITYQNNIGQDVPLNKKAWIRVQSAISAMMFTLLLKFGTERAKQNLATTATGTDLQAIGVQYETPINVAVATELVVDLPAENGTIISVARKFVSVLTGKRYDVQAQVVAAGGVATITLLAQEPGAAGNLDNAAELTIDSPVAGAESTALVTATNIVGTNEEEQEAYRARVLDAIREAGGGGNSSDYRSWSQEVAGVKKAYPFAGQPEDSLAESSPPDRTVYIEATSDIDPEGIAPQGLLDQVRDSITTDPLTGKARQPLGLTDETLFIQSIKRTGFYVEVREFFLSDSLIAQAETEITDALTTYFLSLESFVDGLDPDFVRNDLITDVTISGVVDNVLRSLGGSAAGVGFGIIQGTFLPSYTIAPGELVKLIQVDFQ